MRDFKTPEPKIQLLDFVNNQQELKAGKIEILGAFVHHMEEIVKITTAPESKFKQLFEDFKNLAV